jgi:hypothetical protein
VLRHDSQVQQDSGALWSSVQTFSEKSPTETLFFGKEEKKNKVKFRSAFLWTFFQEEKEKHFSEHFLLFRFSLRWPKKKFSSFLLFFSV